MRSILLAYVTTSNARCVLESGSEMAAYPNGVPCPNAQTWGWIEGIEAGYVGGACTTKGFADWAPFLGACHAGAVCTLSAGVDAGTGHCAE